jgi:hypothetical protein
MADRIDRVQRVRYMGVVANRWLVIRLALVGAFVVLFTALFGVLSRHLALVSSAGLIGLAITYALNVCAFFDFD